MPSRTVGSADITEVEYTGPSEAGLWGSSLDRWVASGALTEVELQGGGKDQVTEKRPPSTGTELLSHTCPSF